MSEGVLYVAVGKEHINYAKKSAQSVKHHCPDLGTAIVCDIDFNSPHIDHILPLIKSSDSWGSNSHPKMHYFQESPFDRTIYLDNDTLVRGDISILYDLLENFDICASHAPMRKYNLPNYPQSNIPDAFPEYNTGVLVFEDPCSSKVNELFNSWIKYYKIYAKQDIYVDQPSFRTALFNSDVRVATLPSEYNCRTVKSGYVQEDVKIFHGTNNNIDKIADKLNQDAGEPRVFVSENGHCLSVITDISYFCQLRLNIRKFLNSVREDGFIGTTKKIVKTYKQQ